MGSVGSGLSRRDFLKGFASLVTGSLISSQSCKSTPNSSREMGMDSVEKLSGKYWPRVREALESAGNNANELEMAIKYFQEDDEKLEAISFLVGDTHRRVSQEFPQNKWRSDLAQGGASETQDSRVIETDTLIRNVELAFEARDRFPWAKELYEIDKEMFFSRVLPYRVGTGSLSQLGEIDAHWREFFLREDVFNSMAEKHDGFNVSFSDLQAKLDEFSERYRGAEDVLGKREVLEEAIAYFDIDLFHNGFGAEYFARGPQERTLDAFLTPGIKDEKKMRGGRCTDLDNMLRLGLMSVGVPITATRFIASADGDSNHQIVSCDLFGEHYSMSAMLCSERISGHFSYKSGLVAKAYEEDWGNWGQASKEAVNLRDREVLPWYIDFYLRTRSMIDVTSRYGAVGDVDIENLEHSKLVFLGVMNNDSDIHSLGTASVAVERTDDDGSVVFKDVGHMNDVLYFAYHYGEPVIDGKRTPSAYLVSKPFIFEKDGDIRHLQDERTGEAGFSVKIGKHNDVSLRKNSEYEFFSFSSGEWDEFNKRYSEGRWRSKGFVNSDNSSNVSLEGVQENVLYVLRDSERFSRPFVYSSGDGVKRY